MANIPLLDKSKFQERSTGSCCIIPSLFLSMTIALLLLHFSPNQRDSVYITVRINGSALFYFPP